MKKIAVILCGCGRMDGSEVHESVLTLLSLDRRNAQIQMFAPNEVQYEVVEHLSNNKVSEQRNMLLESARIARGEIKDIVELDVNNFDAIIFPGGTGMAKNLFTYALDGSDFMIHPVIESLVKNALSSKKPMGFICIAPVLLAKISESIGINAVLTIGNDANIAQHVEQMGAKHVDCSATEIAVDEDLFLVTTPAYMLGKSISEVAQGIDKLVEKVLEFTER